jgi:hypothetical protein
MVACRRCGVRWAQYRGLCRTCDPGPGDRAIQNSRQRIERDAARCQRRLPRATVAIRTAVIEGVEFEVVFDGT